MNQSNDVYIFKRRLFIDSNPKVYWEFIWLDLVVAVVAVDLP